MCVCVCVYVCERVRECACVCGGRSGGADGGALVTAFGILYCVMRAECSILDEVTL